MIPTVLNVFVRGRTAANVAGHVDLALAIDEFLEAWARGEAGSIDAYASANELALACRLAVETKAYRARPWATDALNDAAHAFESVGCALDVAVALFLAHHRANAISPLATEVAHAAHA